MSWETCLLDSDYEICDEYPYDIRRKSDGYIIKEFDKGNGYIRIRLNGKYFYKHRAVAEQWLPNPDNLPFVDHIDRDPGNYHLSNLRWVSISENNRNKTGSNGYQYTLVNYEDAPEDLIEVTHYNTHEFEDYYYSIDENKFYFDTGLYYRELPSFINKSGSAYVNMTNVKRVKIHIFFTKFKKMYQID